jgi:hypothetical protein
VLGLLAGDHGILGWCRLFAEALGSLEFLDDFLGKEKFLLKQLSCGLGRNTCLLLLLLLLLLLYFLWLNVNLLLLLGVLNLWLLHLDFLGRNVLSRVHLVLSLVNFVHLLLLGSLLLLLLLLLLMHWSRSVQASVALLLGLGLLTILLLDETVPAGGRVPALAPIFHICELLADELRVNGGTELLSA